MTTSNNNRNNRRNLTTEDVINAIFNDDSSDDEGEFFSCGSSIDEYIDEEGDDVGITFVPDPDPCFRDSVLYQDLDLQRIDNNDNIADGNIDDTAHDSDVSVHDANSDDSLLTGQSQPQPTVSSTAALASTSRNNNNFRVLPRGGRGRGGRSGRGRRSRKGEKRNTQASNTPSVWTVLSDDEVYVDPNNDITFHEHCGLNRTAMLANTVLEHLMTH